MTLDKSKFQPQPLLPQKSPEGLEQFLNPQRTTYVIGDEGTRPTEMPDHVFLVTRQPPRTPSLF